MTNVHYQAQPDDGSAAKPYTNLHIAHSQSGCRLWPHISQLYASSPRMLDRMKMLVHLSHSKSNIRSIATAGTPNNMKRFAN